MAPDPTNMKRKVTFPSSQAPKRLAMPLPTASVPNVSAPNIPAQNLFLIRCRDNNIPGSTGLKEWELVTAEFNERFKDELKKGFAWKTLQKRYGRVKKEIARTDGGYDARFAIPEDVEEQHEVEGVEEQAEQAEMEDEEKKVQAVEAKPTFEDQTPNPFNNILMPPPATKPNKKVRTIATKAPRGRKPENQPMSTDVITVSPASHPGFYTPSAIPEDYITPLTRAKFHLRHRINDQITFQFLDPDEAEIVSSSPQYISASKLFAISPSSFTHNDIIPVPSPTTAHTVNIFLQLISPHPATQLPTHYLWSTSKPQPGIYDRFGSIRVEKITWDVHTLLSLIYFAQSMHVPWIVDMCIDRLHFQFTEQNRLRDTFAAMRSVSPKGRLPTVAPLEGVDAEDFDDAVLQRLSGDIPTLRFVADVLHSLGATVSYNISPEVRSVFEHADAKYLDELTREEFCKRYHHHGGSGCYTAHATYPVEEYINALYDVSTPQDIVEVSHGLAPVGSLENILYAGTGDAEKLKKDNSAPAMLETEKMILEMEMRVEEAKEVLRRARDAGEKEKDGAIRDASEVVQAMFEASRVVQS